MDQLWTPWRFDYVSQGVKGDGCIFCDKAAADPTQNRDNLILHRAHFNFIILNLFPYTTGHSMIVPYAHVAGLAGVGREALCEMIELARDLEAALAQAYRPEGYNLGMNLGKVAGAGVADHVHLHVLPRWAGDTNFMTVVGETRVHPEDLLITFDKLIGVFRR
jgi:ATP adenylyltransferase